MHKTLLIALDGATFTVLDDLMAKGEMPFLESFRRNGARASLMSTPHPVTPPAFASMITGRSPGNHGIFDFIVYQETRNGPVFNLCDSLFLRCETLWSMVSGQGRRVTASNFILTEAGPGVNGCVIPGWVPPRYMSLHSQPDGIIKELEKEDWFDPDLLCNRSGELGKIIAIRSTQEQTQWVRHHIRREKAWCSLVAYLMDRRPADLTAVVFDGVDRIQHVSWDLIRPGADRSSLPPEKQGLMDDILSYFRLLDRHIALLAEKAGSNADVFIVSDHGFTGFDTGFRANLFLAREGLFFPASSPAGGGRGGKGDFSAQWTSGMRFDPEKTKAFALSPGCNGIFLRTRSEYFPGGIPLSAYDDTLGSLREKLLAIVHPDTGRPLFETVLTRQEAFPGNAAHLAPDLTLVFKESGIMSTVLEPPMVSTRDRLRGTHHREGIFMARGPGIAKGLTHDAPLSILDVTPAVLHSLNLSVPENLEGRVPLGIFAQGGGSGAVSFGPPAHEEGLPAGTDPKGGKNELTPQEAMEVQNRLRQLGYLE